MTDLLLGPVLRHVGETDATVWVETDAPATVTVLGCSQETFTVAGHHYALVVVTGLTPGSTNEYTVQIDGAQVWPLADSTFPASRIATLGQDRPVRIAFGSCRYATAEAIGTSKGYDADALDGYSRRLARQVSGVAGDRLGDNDTDPLHRWPTALIMLGDQVYADETSPATQKKIKAKRDITKGSKDQVADFEEYTWLYHESWADPDVRWLMSTVPCSMIFDDHDVRDDWNTSEAWRQDVKKTDWWSERIIGGLSSYWVYQHIGNLSVGELAENDLYAKVLEAGRDGGDAEPILREFAVAADAEADGAKGARWSYRRDFGDVRLLVIDSRCGRILADGRRTMVSDAEFDWIEQQVEGDYEHLLIGTSLPWLMPRALHDVEAWNELMCAGRRGKWAAKVSEKLRRAADFEHWAAFSESFQRFTAMIAAVGRGDYATADGKAPATVCVLSGDVHHAYVAHPEFTPADGVRSQVYQLTCSPLHNRVPAVVKVGFRAAWSRIAERSTRVLLGTIARVPRPPVEWTRTSGPYFGNDLMTLTLTGRRADLLLEQAGPRQDDPTLSARLALQLADGRS
ncbi:alkaline phosphatase family protein [Nakamurella flava]|uniref:Alkaline phosphatase family protein n=1 Tax=Nakamurella flava TaxID=2576308 RepID=A0A4U6QBS3_9ACTN|nr:alkaline phosphatase family protein [Nakamurella flava]